MVAGILEKSKRLRWIIFFAILGDSCFQAAWGCVQRGMRAQKCRAEITAMLAKLGRGTRRKQTGTRKDMFVRGRRTRRLLLSNL
jgi:hypothetical protein